MIQDVSKGLGITVLIPETYITEENLFATIGFWNFFHVACTCLLGWTKSPTRRTRLIDRLVTPNVTEYTDNCCSAYLALMLSVALPCLILVAQISEFIDCVPVLQCSISYRFRVSIRTVFTKHCPFLESIIMTRSNCPYR